MISKLRLSVSLLLCATAALARAGTANPTYTTTDLGTLSSPNTEGTQANAINDLGQVTGYSDVDGTNTHAFLYSNGTISDLGSLGGTFSSGYAINNSGVVAGFANYSGASMIVMGIYAAGGYMGGIGTLGGERSGVAGINDNGTMVGWADTATSTHAFIRTKNGDFTDVSTPFSGSGTNSYGEAINQAGAFVGQAQITGDAHYHAFVAASLGFDLTPALNDDSCAYALNNGVDTAHSRIVGSIGNGSAERAEIFAVGVAPIPLGSLPGGDNSSRALGVNDAGLIVGNASVAGGITHAFICDSTATTPTMVDLNDFIPSNGIVLTSATGINASGQICAIGHDATAATPLDRAYLVSPIVAPTPAPIPPVVAAPTLAGKKAVKTSGTSATVKGTAGGSVTSVTYKIGSKKGTAKGTASWSFKATDLKSGKNTATVVAHGPGGDSAPLKITITRS